MDSVALNKELTQELKDRRKELGLLQVAVADSIGVSPTYYNRIENGLQPRMDLERLQKWAGILKKKAVYTQPQLVLEDL
tara:strand:- start:1312 stop:1548 length:237 start_codon:yes stop_codon:yes gene_type:complete